MNLQHRLATLTPAKVASGVAVTTLVGAMIVAALLVQPAPGYRCSGGSCMTKGDAIAAIFGVHRDHTVFTDPGLLHVCQVVAIAALAVLALTKLAVRVTSPGAPVRIPGSARR